MKISGERKLVSNNNKIFKIKLSNKYRTNFSNNSKSTKLDTVLNKMSKRKVIIFSIKILTVIYQIILNLIKDLQQKLRILLMGQVLSIARHIKQIQSLTINHHLQNRVKTRLKMQKLIISRFQDNKLKRLNSPVKANIQLFLNFILRHTLSNYHSTLLVQADHRLKF